MPAQPPPACRKITRATSQPHPVVHVCPLAQVADEVARTGARHLVTLLAGSDLPPTPPSIPGPQHLRLSVDDITESLPGMMTPKAQHVRQLIAFATQWDRAAPMLIHCHAGISRSTAAAFVVMCALHPDVAPAAIAVALREAAPWACPNERIVALADELLDRGGTMLIAVTDLGLSELGSAPRPFRLAGPFR